MGVCVCVCFEGGLRSRRLAQNQNYMTPKSGAESLEPDATQTQTGFAPFLLKVC